MKRNEALLAFALAVAGLVTYQATHAPTPAGGKATPVVVPPKSPAPPPAPKRLKMVIVTQADCPPCVALKKALDASPTPLAFDVEWIDAHKPNPYKATMTPTLIKLDTDGKEVGRRVGFADLASLVVWMKE